MIRYKPSCIESGKIRVLNAIAFELIAKAKLGGINGNMY
jgi:hypothetical protein|tara:strand:+ start:132 stop:248 length:117 start_codon:yes stop_codon:yes gene_type:complete